MKKKLLCIILGMVLVLSVVPISAKSKPKLNYKTIYMSTADKTKLKVMNNKKKVKWSSNNKKVVRVSKKGVVTPRWFGKATITAKFGNKKLKCKVCMYRRKRHGLMMMGTKSLLCLHQAKKRELRFE